MSLAACAGIVERGDADRFLAAMSCPPAAREVLFPLYAFNVEVSRAPWVTEEPMIAEMRLQWWRDAVEEIAAGKPPRAHEVAAPLAKVINAHDLPPDLFDAAIAARRWEVHSEPFEDDAAFGDHIDCTAGHLMWLCARACGAGAGQEGQVRDAAFAAGVANWLRAVPELEGRGRYPLPDGRPEAVRALARGALERLTAAHRAPAGAALPALRASWDAGPVLRRAARDPAAVVEGRLLAAPAWRRLRLMRLAMVRGW